MSIEFYGFSLVKVKDGGEPILPKNIERIEAYLEKEKEGIIIEESTQEDED